MSTDKYESMEQLINETKGGIDWVILTKVIRSKCLLSAIHGGSIEPGCTEVALELSRLAMTDFYSFKGIRANNNSELHVTSIRYDESIIKDMLAHAHFSLAIHGASGNESEILLGGSDETNRILLEKALLDEGFKVKQAPSNLEGSHPSNINNQNIRQKGVQLELTKGFRSSLFKNGDLSKKNRENKDNYTDTFSHFVEVLSQSIKLFKY